MTDYDDARLQRNLVEDTDIAEQGIDVSTEDGRVILRGYVESPQRRDAIEERAHHDQPGATIVNEIVVVATEPPVEAEVLP